MPQTVRYNTFRLAMLLVVGAICYIAGARGLVLLVLACVISLPLSYVLLARWRRAMIDEIASGKGQKLNFVRTISDKIDAANDAEDARVDEAIAADESSDESSTESKNTRP